MTYHEIVATLDRLKRPEAIRALVQAVETETVALLTMSGFTGATRARRITAAARSRATTDAQGFYADDITAELRTWEQIGASPSKMLTDRRYHVAWAIARTIGYAWSVQETTTPPWAPEVRA